MQISLSYISLTFAALPGVIGFMLIIVLPVMLLMVVGEC